MQDPYIEILAAMQRQGASTNPPGIKLAEVVAPPPDIVIKMGDLQVDKDNVRIADYLLPGYTRQANQQSTGNIITHVPVPPGEEPQEYDTYTQIESLTHSGTIALSDTLKPGDVVAVMPTTDGQTYIVLAKVVSLA